MRCAGVADHAEADGIHGLRGISTPTVKGNEFAPPGEEITKRVERPELFRFSAGQDRAARDTSHIRQFRRADFNTL